MKQENWTPDQYRKYEAEQKTKKANAAFSKFGNFQTIIDGIKFDSKKEAQYYGKCKLRVRAGELKKFEYHVRFPIIVNGQKICTYEADFVLYFPNGDIRVFDVKTVATEGLPVFRLKKKLMLAVHNINVEIV